MVIASEIVLKPLVIMFQLPKFSPNHFPKKSLGKLVPMKSRMNTQIRPHFMTIRMNLMENDDMLEDFKEMLEKLTWTEVPPTDLLRSTL